MAATPNWPLPDLTILDEVEGELGARLLMDLYNVRLFAETPADQRSGLFVPHARAAWPVPDAPGPVLEGVMLLSRLVNDPAGVSSYDLARVCRAIAEWAENHSLPVTSVAYAEVAAHLLPSDPEMANLAGRACRRAAERQRAELWYERGAGLARRAGNALEQVNGLLGFGNLYRDHGDLGRAFIWIRRAGRTARRNGLRESAGEALHDAFFLSYLSENLRRAAVWAERAAKIYPVHAARFPYFAADLCLLLGRYGFYTEAVTILREVQVHLRAPVEQLQLWAILAWVSGGAQDRATYERALARVQELVDHLPYASAAALAYGAAGAQHLGEWALAEQLIGESRARPQNALAARLADRVHADVSTRSPGVVRPGDEDPGLRALLATTAYVVQRLKRWRGATWRPRRAAQ
ncbi:hypothetical protein [Longimicrobium sp.]|uniref:hypothetical protein n=1 Tax=Longimicrobium sp. TaxID=2029185 RepID=UPI002E2ECE1D|nr:hypothetical protein [Longimicrobium sp.]HEX6040965.1 hypothetical protein [Longimicrobium sp.]